MKYSVQSNQDEELGVVDSRDAARQLILDHAKTIVGDRYVATMEYALCFNSTVSAIAKERVTHIREDWEGNWSLIWFDGPKLSDVSYPDTVPENDYHDKFFFVFESDE